MKRCPFCAEDIQDAAVLCRFCGSSLDAVEQPATTFKRSSQRKIETLSSDGSPGALWTAVADAVVAAGLPLINRDRSSFSLAFESRGMTWQGNAGEIVFVTVEAAADGSTAQFVAKTKPAGIGRIERSVSARKWVDKLSPHLRPGAG